MVWRMVCYVSNLRWNPCETCGGDVGAADMRVLIGNCTLKLWEGKKCKGRYLGKATHINWPDLPSACWQPFRDIDGVPGSARSAKIECKPLDRGGDCPLPLYDPGLDGFWMCPQNETKAGT
ncbi:uncharacterized protein CLAFUR5_05157 [Fulvia fulva]|uniref:Uncharacterized protein n=1 Tax=Passalora fulva TaxID=5499 RepID=A0A9Q8P873_PASFU|nr:uncharacterized protein CLAFUR5_05157 [Fulvia fulva]KAK4616992.1 hypothetical protein CLAFUR0_10696 [Fulvia fulva]UJO16859.1 hypothetical protein CLAFUR5_05157 [Fulvia fulva]